MIWMIHSMCSMKCLWEWYFAVTWKNLAFFLVTHYGSFCWPPTIRLIAYLNVLCCSCHHHELFFIFLGCLRWLILKLSDYKQPLKSCKITGGRFGGVVVMVLVPFWICPWTSGLVWRPLGPIHTGEVSHFPVWQRKEAHHINQLRREEKNPR